MLSCSSLLFLVPQFSPEEKKKIITQMCSEHDLINVSSALEQTGDQRALSPSTPSLQHQDSLNENAYCIICWLPARDNSQSGLPVNVFAFSGTVWLYEASVHQSCILGTCKVYVLGR